MMQPTEREIASIFLRLGATAFGGPAAHIAMMRREFVERRGWISPSAFTDMLAIVNLIPGPNSTELAIHIGAELGGRRGLWIAGICFILPAFSIVMVLAALYDAYGSLPDVTAIMAGVKPVVLGIIAHALWKLAAGIARPWVSIPLVSAVFTLGLLGVDELVLLFGCGAFGALLAVGKGKSESGGKGTSPDDVPAGDARAGDAPAGDDPPPAKHIGLFGLTMGGLFGSPTLGSIFLYFLYVGSVLYGSGYVLVAFLRDDLVGRLGWLTERQLLDAVSIGQVTPGPVFTTATFIGWLLGGFSGGVVATLGIFLPSFIFILAARGWVARFRSRPAMSGFLDGVNAAAIALIGVALVALGDGVFTGLLPIVLAIASLAVLIRTKLNPVWVIAVGGVVGWLMSMGL